MTAPTTECPAAIRCGQANAVVLWRALNAAQAAQGLSMADGVGLHADAVQR